MRQVEPVIRRRGADSRPSMADMSKVILMNVVLATAFLVFFFHAPLTYAALGAGTAGFILWARERRLQARRTR